MFNFIEKEQGKETKQKYLEKIRENELIAIREHKATPLWLITEGLNIIGEYLRFDAFYGIISSNFHESILELLNKYALTDRFNVIIGRDDVNKIKPHPEGLIRVMHNFNLEPNRVLFIGDLSTDEEAANRAQVHYIDVKEIKELLKK